jgi:flap endonuclease-1
MGIKSLMKLIKDEAPGSFKDTKLKNYTGKKIAIDASTQLYQYFVMIRTSDQSGFNQMLTSEDGRTTSHIQGFLNRTIKLMEGGIRPIYVFDGKPPDLKIGELKKRKAAKEKAHQDIKDVTEKHGIYIVEKTKELVDLPDELVDEVNKLSKRTVRVTKEHNEEVKKLLRLMGVPIIEAPGEAEATCSAICATGKVYAAGTEDMDALTFGTPILIRNLSFAGSSKKRPIQEISLKKVLRDLQLTQSEFIDLCILCGCDYSPSIKGIGPKKGYALIKTHKTIENVIKHVKEKTKYTVPKELEDNLDEIRELFYNPDVTTDVDLKFKKPDVKGLKEYLVTELNFNEERVDKSIYRLKKALNISSQRSIESFFVKKV